MHDEILLLIREKVRIKKSNLPAVENLGKIIGDLRTEGFVIERNNIVEITEKGRKANYNESLNYDFRKLADQKNV